MQNYFKGTKEHPYHLSVGAVALNEKNEVCCHYFTEIKGHASFAHLKNFYILMRETMEMGESIEQTLHRGLKEEFGITGEIVDYLGSTRDEYFDPGKDSQIEKTTLYFLVKTKTFNPELRNQEDVEVESKIEWQSCDYLIEKMKEQGIRFGNMSLDESSILEKVKTYI
ncbi:MAG: NUDIX hydrolase [Patescibacteria group bacterium]